MKKKKVSFITIFDNPNFGTYLQALALGLMIEKLGAKAEVVHYERPIWHVFPKWLMKFHFLEPLYLLKAYVTTQVGLSYSPMHNFPRCNQRE